MTPTLTAIWSRSPSATDGDHGSVEIVGAGNNVRVQYTPDADFHGADSFAYTAGDGNGGSDTATVTITIDPINDDPVADDEVATVFEDLHRNVFTTWSGT